MMLFPNAGTGPAGVFLLVASVGPVQRREHGGTSAPHLAEGAAESVGPTFCYLVVGSGLRIPFCEHVEVAWRLVPVSVPAPFPQIQTAPGTTAKHREFVRRRSHFVRP
jgi:hypothetical protein